MYDNEALTSPVDDFDPVTEEQRHKARLLVCTKAIDATEAAEVMKMLGIYPGQEEVDLRETRHGGYHFNTSNLAGGGSTPPRILRGALP